MAKLKLCLFCKQFDFTPGQHHYSSATPGYAATMECSKDHWKIDMFYDSTKSYRLKILTAVNCKDFIQIKV